MALDGPQLGPGVAHQLWHEGTTSVVWAQLKRWQDANQFQRRAQGLGVWQDIHGEAVSSVENECHKISLQFLIFVLILRVGMWCIFLCRTSNIIIRRKLLSARPQIVTLAHKCFFMYPSVVLKRLDVSFKIEGCLRSITIFYLASNDKVSLHFCACNKGSNCNSCFSVSFCLFSSQAVTMSAYAKLWRWSAVAECSRNTWRWNILPNPGTHFIQELTTLQMESWREKY